MGTNSALQASGRIVLTRGLCGFTENVGDTTQGDHRFARICKHAAHMTNRPNDHAFISEKGE